MRTKLETLHDALSRATENPETSMEAMHEAATELLVELMACGAVRVEPTGPQYTYTCDECGGENVSHDGVARWNVATQAWGLSATYDDAFCDDCQAECDTNEREITEATVYCVQARELPSGLSWDDVRTVYTREEANQIAADLDTHNHTRAHRVIPVWPD